MDNLVTVHVLAAIIAKNEQRIGINRITSRNTQFLLIPHLLDAGWMDLAYTHGPSRASMALHESRGLHLYLRTLEAAVEDDIVTDEEMSILSVIARAFALPGDIMSDAWVALHNSGENPIDPDNAHAYETRQMGDATTYQTALVAALADEIITEDEWAMLDVMRRVMNIQPDEHALIEEAVRGMAANSENGESFVNRLDRYVTLHPYH